MQYVNERFSVFSPGTKQYRDNYELIQWRVAQQVEPSTVNAVVPGSKPGTPAKTAPVQAKGRSGRKEK